MPSAHPYLMLGAEDFFDPVSFHYEMRTPWGLLAQDLSVDIRILLTKDEYVPAIGLQLWQSTIATAITSSCSLDMMYYVRWHTSPLALPWPPGFSQHGYQTGLPAGKLHCPIVLMHTGHTDNYAAREIVLPSTPLRWQAGGLLSEDGWDSLMQWAFGVRMGLAGEDIGGDLQHIIAYPHIVEPSIDNLAGVLFRKVTHLKVLQYTDKAPDLPSGLWP